MERPLEEIRLQDYHYALPNERIAQYPLAHRAEAKLLHYQQGKISHHVFRQLPKLLPEDSFLLFNNTQVVKARLFLQRESGGLIEVLLLYPTDPKDIAQVMQSNASCTWQCMVKRRKRWRNGETLHMSLNIQQPTQLKLSWVHRDQQIIRFQWDDPELNFARLLEAVGKLPLPPYINREAQAMDLQHYQTVYAEKPGAVAAPTAGLHFTEQVLSDLAQQHIESLKATLHVGAGTFLPVKEDQVSKHDMHSEEMLISLPLLKNLIELEEKKSCICVGTTSLRFVESLYWLGVQILNGETYPDAFSVGKLPYTEMTANISNKEALTAIYNYMLEHDWQHWSGLTRILILPGYTFRICKGLITNYHMPGTTLILLIAAFIGEDWRKVYESALAEGYRFLSYGDSSLLLP